MVKLVTGDESLEAAVDAVVATSLGGVQVGLLIGRIAGSGSKDFVVGLVRTPVKEDGTDAASILDKQSSSKSRTAVASSIDIDVDWVAEHARQVSRMLLGGLQVVGLYCLATENAFKQSSSVLSRTAKEIAAATDGLANCSDRLILHIATSPRRLVCRVCPVDGSVLTLKPCEWKLGKVVSNLQALACPFEFDLSLPICTPDSSETFKSRLHSLISSEALELEGAEAIVAGSLLDASAPLPFSGKICELELLTPCAKHRHFEESSKVMGTIKLKGTVNCRAYIFAREPGSHALRAVKEDILGSLRSRVALMAEEYEQSPAKDGVSIVSPCSGVDTAFGCVLPRRVLIPWNGFLVCDYLSPTETLKDVADRCKDLLAADLSSFLEVERFPEATKGEEVATPQHRQQHSLATSLRLPLPLLLVAVLVALTAIMLVVRGA